MLISQRWLKEFTDFSCTPNELEHILTMLGLEVEKIINPAESLRGFVVGEVLTREKHPNADKLSVCTVKLSESQTNTIVCGAPNVAAGQKIPVATEGAIVPNGGFAIAKRKIRGVESNGMICSREELGLDEASEGIWELPADAPVGTPLAEYLGMDDVLYEISITPNRADCLSHLGIAREIAAYFRAPLRTPTPTFTEGTTNTSEHVTVNIEDTEVCWRFAARVVRGVTIKESPEWLRSRLIACGQRPINNVVDVTNYVMLECGKPIHAFDLDKVAGKTLVVKRASDGEQFRTLDGKSRTLDSAMTMVWDAQQASGVGGIMGGEVSEVSEATVNVCIESALWKPSAIRKAAKKLGISSEASYRFERGVDPETAVYAAERAAQLIQEIAGGTVARGVLDVHPVPQPEKRTTVRFARAAMLIGKSIPSEEQRSLLERLGCVVESSDAVSMTVRIPTHRVDVETETDLIEEIARLHGYDNIEPDLSSRVNLSGERTPDLLAPLPLQSELSALLRSNGFHEVMTQNMIDPKSASFFMAGDATPVRIANPLGEELSCLRPSLVPSMLKVVERNVRYGQKNLRLFEMGTRFTHVSPSEKTFITGFKEQKHLIVALAGSANATTAGNKHWSGSERLFTFYDIKGVLESLAEAVRLDGASVRPASTPPPLMSPNCVELVVGKNKMVVGYAGELAASDLKAFDLDVPVFVCVFYLWALPQLAQKPRKYTSVSPYPTISRDLAFVTDATVEAESVRSLIAREAGEHARSVELFDVFVGAEGKSVGAGKKSLAFALQYNSPEKTLADSDVDASIQRIINSVQTTFGATLRA